MANLGTPKITVTFSELGITAINRGSKGTVAIILRDATELDPVGITQAAGVPSALGADNQAYVQRAFLGYVNPPRKVILYVAPARAESGGATQDANLSAALAYMATQDFDYIVGPADCTADEAAAIAAWVKSQRANNDAKYKAVLPDYDGDHYALVNFTADGMKAGAVTYTTAAYCSRIAGLLAGTPMKISATYAPLPELGDVERLTKEAQATAVNGGELILIWDGRKVKLSRAVTSLTTTSDGMLDSFKKIKIVEIMDLIRTDITATAEDGYIGKYANTYENKLLLVTAVRGYFMGLERDSLVQPGYTVDIDVDRQEQWLTAKGVDTSGMTVQEIREADTGSHVFLRVSCKILDAIEDIEIAINI